MRESRSNRNPRTRTRVEPDRRNEILSEIAHRDMEVSMADLMFRDCGSIVMLNAGTETGTEWIDENVSDDGFHFGADRVVEARYAGPIIEGAVEAGLTVTVDGWEVVL